MNEPTSTLRAMTGLPTVGMRRAVLRERLEALDPGEAAGLLHALVARALAGHAGARRALLGFALDWIALHRDGRDLRCDDLHDAVARGGYDALAAMLATGEPRCSLARRGRLREISISDEKHLALPWPDRPAGSWGNLHAVEILRLHPSPSLLARLLRQRWFRLANALAVASRRPTSARVAFTLACSERWLSRIEVRTALVLNPFTPVPIALCLLPLILAGRSCTCAMQGMAPRACAKPRRA